MRLTVSLLPVVTMLSISTSVWADAPQYTVTDLGAMQVADINTAGSVAGTGYFNGAHHGALTSVGEPTTDLGTLPGTYVVSDAYGVNDSGVACGGSYSNTENSTHSVIFTGGNVVDLGVWDSANGFISSSASDINNSGELAGTAVKTNPFPLYRPYKYENGVASDIGVLPGGSSGAAYGINNLGQIVGYSNGPTFFQHAFLYSDDGTMQDLGTLAGPTGNSSFAKAVNDGGDVAGFSDTTTATNPPIHAFLYHNGVMQDLGSLVVGGNSAGLDVNASDEVVGTTDTPSGSTHLFLYKDGTMYDLADLIPADSGVTSLFFGSSGSDTVGHLINDAGQIAVNGQINGEEHALLLTPVATTPTPTPTPVPIPAPVAVAPTITVKSPIKTSKSSYRLEGTATGAIVVNVKIGKKGKAKAASGTDSWSEKIKLVRGTNEITVQAFGATGLSSRVVKVKIVRS